MSLSRDQLTQLGNLVRRFAQAKLREKQLTDSLRVDSVVLYGGAAKYQLRMRKSLRDFDLNVFLSKKTAYENRQAAKFNRRGRCWPAGCFSHRCVEVMFNTLSAAETWKEYVLRRSGGRWEKIKPNPIVQIVPHIEKIRRLRSSGTG